MNTARDTGICFSFDVVSGRILQADAGLEAQTGMTEAELTACSVFDLIDPSDLGRVQRALVDMASTGRAAWFCHLRSGERISDFLSCDTSLRSDGATAYVLATVVRAVDVIAQTNIGSVTDETRQGAPLLTEMAHNFVTDHLFELSVSCLAVLDRSGTVLVANPHFSAAQMVGDQEIIGQSIQSLLSLDAGAPLLDAIARVPAGTASPEMTVPVKSASVDRTLGVRVVAARDGSVVFFVGHDITKEQRLNAELVSRATTDQLTQLANRETFNQALERAVRAGESVTLIMLDLDDFKQVNDALGHAVGDDLLSTTGNRIRAVVRKADTVARFGGDEFMVMLRGVDSTSDAESLAEKIRLALSLPCVLGGRKLHVTASIGVAVSSAKTRDAAMLFHQADAAVYEAKRLGRNRWVVHDLKLEQVLHEQSEVESELRAALTSNGIVPFVQGIQSVDATLRGVEVLVRMRAEDGSIKGPGYFLDVARQLGLLAKVGEQVFDKALEQLAPWLAENSEHTVSLNADPREIMVPGFARMFRRLVNRHGVAPRQIYLEVTETGFLVAGGMGGQAITELREMGLKIAIDDFGTGASSLGYLRDLAIDRIKIDRTFVTNLHLNPSNATITETVIRLGEALGMNVVAEGVESQRELDHLTLLGSPLIQGYLMHKPEPIPAFLERQKPVAHVING